MLQLHNLIKSYGNIKAVDNLSLEIKNGEIFGLLGPNGAGKTTTLSMAAGQLDPDSGSVVIDGLGSPADPVVRRKIGIAPQALALYNELSSAENLSFWGSLYGLSGKRLRERVDWALAFAGLQERRGQQVEKLSGGMQRRLNLAVALVHDPPLILLDEPTAGVDAQSRNAILERIEALRDEGRTVVYTTHYMEEAQRLCDRVGIVDHGQLLALDTVPNLLMAYDLKSEITIVRGGKAVRSQTDDPAAEIARLQAQGPLGSFSVKGPDLEDVFLHLTGRHLRDT